MEGEGLGFYGGKDRGEKREGLGEGLCHWYELLFLLSSDLWSGSLGDR